MATQQFEKIKPWALFIFVVINVLLVLLILGENLTGGGSGSTGFVRSTPETSSRRATTEIRPTVANATPTAVYHGPTPSSMPAAAVTATLRPALTAPAATGTPELSPALQDK